MTTILFVWMVVAAKPGSTYFEWSNAGEFINPAACRSAAANLGLDHTKFRCIGKGDGAIK